MSLFSVLALVSVFVCVFSCFCVFLGAQKTFEAPLQLPSQTDLLSPPFFFMNKLRRIYVQSFAPERKVASRVLDESVWLSLMSYLRKCSSIPGSCTIYGCHVNWALGATFPNVCPWLYLRHRHSKVSPTSKLSAEENASCIGAISAELAPLLTGSPSQN